MPGCMLCRRWLCLSPPPGSSLFCVSDACWKASAVGFRTYLASAPTTTRGARNGGRLAHVGKASLGACGGGCARQGTFGSWAPIVGGASNWYPGGGSSSATSTPRCCPAVFFLALGLDLFSTSLLGALPRP